MRRSLSVTHLSLTALLLASLSLGGCQTAAVATAPDVSVADTTVTSPAVAAVPADDNLNAVLWVQRSAEYRAVAETIYRAATDKLDTALKTPGWDALVPEERANASRNLPPAVVMDVDETVLDNSPYQARLVRDGLEYKEATWDAWVREEKAQPVPGVVEFARAAQARGITVLYISNRAEYLGPATLANLRAVGLPVKDDTVFLGLGTMVDGCKQEGTEKLCRRQFTGRTYRVLMQFGDQLGDFTQILDNTPAARAELQTRYHGWFGERWWMLPNPTYGSWEPALFNNDRNQTRELRREAKRDALNTGQ